MDNILLEVKNISVSFDTFSGEVQAVRNVDFHINHGEIVSIVGESGSGKSVMTQSLTKLLPSRQARIKSGEIIYAGQNIATYPFHQMRKIRGKEITYIFQDPMTSLNPTAKIGKQVIEGLLSHEKTRRSEAKKYAIDLLRMTGIPNPEKRYNQYPHELSGGMRQRAMIAIAIACKPKLLIADEPTTSLDVTIQSRILEILKNLNKTMGMSIILITHDLGVVAGIAERVAIMYGGRIVEQCDVAGIFTNPLHPYTQALLRSVPRLDIDDRKPLDYILGTPPNMLCPPRGCAFAARCRYGMEICEEYYPEEKELSAGHIVSCWLTDPRARNIRVQANGR